MLTALATEYGPAYVDLDEVIVVSSPFTKKGHDPARAVCVAGGHKVFVLDNDHNFGKLRHLLPPDAAPMAQAAPPVVPRGRKTTDAPTLTRDKDGQYDPLPAAVAKPKRTRPTATAATKE